MNKCLSLTAIRRLVVASFALAALSCASLPKPQVQEINPYLSKMAPQQESKPQSPSLAEGGQTAVAAMPKEKPLTLDACIRIALDKNPLLRASQEGVAAATEAIGETKAPYYPDVNFNAEYGRWQRHAFLPDGVTRPGIASVIGPTSDWFAGLRARYTLFDSGERRAKLQTAMARQGIAKEELTRIRQDMVLNVHQAYYGVLAALELHSVARENLKRAEYHLRMAMEKKTAGAIPKAEVIHAQVEVADAKLALVRAVNIVLVARGNVNTALGLPVEMPTEVAIPPEEIISGDLADISTAFEQAVQCRPEIKAGLQRIATARYSIDTARSAGGPKINTEARFGWRDTDFLPADKEWSAGVSLEVPIFTGFLRTHQLNKSQADLSKEEADIRRLVQDVRREVWMAHTKLRETKEAIQASELLVKEARENVMLAEERYKAGAGTTTDLLDAQTLLAKAEAMFVESKWDYQVARAVFNRAKGDFAEL